ncbi:hypothetical protein [Klenkia sp. PcliD-1-E]|uniref:hypothetical protein n=1 Tax=Klenkia sp. PcliD-1-E TaxID=2954492 RepID=UPI002096B913|nr:hypothetical protein [Klenkia sp. PcliD-1-E]MCO7221257.1 hypothetical protein [Klenkia sp. PcliD-1-E]
MILAVGALVGAVLCYGVAGDRLSTGAQAAGSPLRSRTWWTGTGLQAGAFLLALVARHDLPLLVVQSAIVAALAVTAVLQQVTGVRRLARAEAAAVLGTVLGLALLSAATVPGPAVVEGPVLGWLAAGLALAAAGVLLPASTWVSGALAGVGFSVGAVGARVLVSELPGQWWAFWAFPGTVWLAGTVTVGGLLLGQLHLTRGLAGAPAVPVLAVMYVVSTVVPAAVGHWLLDEQVRPGWAVAAVVGCGIALGAAVQLLRGGRVPAAG